jgi:predicted HAD superfamily Cof-like phosphohydrolase
MVSTSNSHQDKWKEKNIPESREEKEMQKQQTNKEKKK